MDNIYAVRFWNAFGECIMVCGKYMHEFDFREDAWDCAKTMLPIAKKNGAVEMDINNDFYRIICDSDYAQI